MAESRNQRARDNAWSYPTGLVNSRLGQILEVLGNVFSVCWLISVYTVLSQSMHFPTFAALLWPCRPYHPGSLGG